MLKGMVESIATGLASGGTVDGDLVVTGDFKVEGAGSFAFDEIVEGTLQVNGNLTIANTSGDSQFIFNTASRSIVLGSQTFVRNLNNTFEYGNTSGLTDHKFFTNTTQRVTINDTGMGLGTSSPEVLLHLDSSSTTELRIQDGTDKKLRIKQQNNGAFFTAETGNSLTFTTNGNTTAMHMDTSQRIGIGTSSPTAKLHILAGNDNDSIRITGDDANYYGSLHYTNASNTTFNILNSYSSNDASAIKLGFGSVSSNVNVMTLLKSGNVGIGTSSPGSHLHIEYTDNTTTSTDSGAGLYEKGLQIENTSTTTSAYSQLHLRAGTSDGYIRYIYNNTNDGRFGFYTDNTNNVQEMMTITNAGLIGIGTDSPNANLETVGTIRISGTAPVLQLQETDAPDASEIFEISPSGGSINFNTRSSTNGYVSTDYQIGRSTGGATLHKFFVGGVSRFLIDTNSRISLSNNDSGTSNTILGKNAGLSLDAGSNYNTFIGEAVSDASMDDASDNVGVGYGALTSLTQGDNNVAIGSLPLNLNTTGSNNIGIGITALRYNATGSSNVAIGSYSQRGASNQNHSYNTSVGANSLYSIETGSENTALGYSALTSLTTATGNTAIGHFSSRQNQTGEGNTSLGHQSLMGASGNSHTHNTAIGNTSMQNITTGSKNTSVGFASGYAISSGEQNSLYGFQSGYGLQLGRYNSAFGYQSLNSEQHGSYSTAFGYKALYSQVHGSVNGNT